AARVGGPGQGLRDAGHPRGLCGGPRRRAAPALYPGARRSMTDEGQTAPTEDRAEGRMSFFDHLAELRKRIIWSLVPTLIGLIVCFRFSDRILLFMRQPLERMDVKLVALTPTEAFWTSMKL